MKFQLSIAMALGAALAASLAMAFQDSSRRLFPLKSLKTTSLTIGKTKLTPWLMDSSGKRQEGMMFLKASELKPNDAMLFVFPKAQVLKFWNQNVSFSLDTAFLDTTGKVIQTLVLKAMDPAPKGPSEDSQYVIEMKQGAFKRIGLKAGMKLTIPRGLSSD